MYEWNYFKWSGRMLVDCLVQRIGWMEFKGHTAFKYIQLTVKIHLSWSYSQISFNVLNLINFALLGFCRSIRGDFALLCDFKDGSSSKHCLLTSWGQPATSPERQMWNDMFYILAKENYKITITINKKAQSWIS